MTNLLHSALLSERGIRHGFNLRTGGASTAAGYRSWNLSRHVGDDPAHVEANHARFARAIGLPTAGLFELAQVHGAITRLVTASDDVGEVRRMQGDALVAAGTGVAVGVRVADCAAVLLANDDGSAVAAVHAGWRGVVAGVVEASIGVLRGPARSSSGLNAAIFPHIGVCCFEVGEEVAAALRTCSPDPDVVDRSRSKPHVDLRAILRAKLLALGLDATRIDSIDGCTRCEADRFFSYRRDGERSGRHIAAIVAT